MKRVFAILLALVMIVAACCVPALAASYPDCEHVGQEITASEDGHFDIAFSDGYKGFCICYGELEAALNDGFTVDNMSLVVNHDTNENVSQYLKCLFTEEFDRFFTYDAENGVQTKDRISLQYYIWHFTDSFSNWRVDTQVADSVRAAAANANIPDHGYTMKINDTTLAVFDFHALKAHNGETYQDFWAYKITTMPYPAPEVTDPTQDQKLTVVEGNSETLSVTATNAETYQWQRDNGSGFVNIANATESTFSLPPISAENAGYKYRCVVSNTVGSDTSPVFSLQMLSAPVFTTPTKDQTIKKPQGSQVTLTAEATQAEGYQWEVDKGNGWEVIEDANGTEYTVPTGSIGTKTYRCLAWNDAGETYSHSFTVTIHEPASTPATGEGATPVILACVMLMSLAGAALMLRRKLA